MLKNKELSINFHKTKTELNNLLSIKSCSHLKKNDFLSIFRT